MLVRSYVPSPSKSHSYCTIARSGRPCVDVLASNVTVALQAHGLGAAVNAASGSFRYTVTVVLSVAQSPSWSVTCTPTVYSPATSYVCDATWLVVDNASYVPSPFQSHSYTSGSSSTPAGSVAVIVTFTDVPASTGPSLVALTAGGRLVTVTTPRYTDSDMASRTWKKLLESAGRNCQFPSPSWLSSPIFVPASPNALVRWFSSSRNLRNVLPPTSNVPVTVTMCVS